MKIQKDNKKRLIIITVIALVAVLLACTGVAATQNLWPFTDDTIVSEDKSNSKKSDTDRGKGGDNNERTDVRDSDDGVNNTPQNPTDRANNNTETPPSPSPSSSYAPPLLNPPSVDDPYPIQNERYEIAQTGEKSFRISLYPLEWDYDAQLREFKSDALDYLGKRYGSTNGLTIEWNPSNAEDI